MLCGEGKGASALLFHQIRGLQRKGMEEEHTFWAKLSLPCFISSFVT